MDKEARYYKDEYENLRRKKNKEIDNLIIRQLKFMDVTWKLLKTLGLPNEFILDYYRKEMNK